MFRDEKEPLQPNNRNQGVIDNEMKRNTSIEFDGRRVISKTGEIIGKNSAVWLKSPDIIAILDKL